MEQVSIHRSYEDICAAWLKFDDLRFVARLYEPRRAEAGTVEMPLMSVRTPNAVQYRDGCTSAEVPGCHPCDAQDEENRDRGSPERVRPGLSSSQVRVVRAHTRLDGKASRRIREKLRFTCVGEVVDPEDGLVWRWELQKAD